MSVLRTFYDLKDMGGRFLLVVMGGVLSLTLACSAEPKREVMDVSGTVVECLSPILFRIRLHPQSSSPEMRERLCYLYGVDVPMRMQAGYDKATAFVRKILAGRLIGIKWVVEKPYFFSVGSFYFDDGTCVADRLVNAGVAVPAIPRRWSDKKDATDALKATSAGEGETPAEWRRDKFRKVLVKRVVAPDTLLVSGLGERRLVRLFGVVGPWPGTAGFEEGRQALAGRIEGVEVQVRTVADYRTILYSHVTYEGEDMSEWMLRNGFCWVDIQHVDFAPSLKAYENEARRKGLGIHACGDYPQPWKLFQQPTDFELWQMPEVLEVKLPPLASFVYLDAVSRKTLPIRLKTVMVQDPGDKGTWFVAFETIRPGTSADGNRGRGGKQRFITLGREVPELPGWLLVDIEAVDAAQGRYVAWIQNRLRPEWKMKVEMEALPEVPWEERSYVLRSYLDEHWQVSVRNGDVFGMAYNGIVERYRLRVIGEEVGLEPADPDGAWYPLQPYQVKAATRWNVFWKSLLNYRPAGKPLVDASWLE
ncbi:MAG: hypothetical protein D6820_11440 [Lentisphaerae bacterium]|nr:MAG: hypothetical protein D6820_11440 [Lentisphaerota bacterium]